MKTHKPLILMLAISLLSPVIAYICYINGIHGIGFTNKGLLIKPMLVDKSLDKYMEYGKFSIISINNPESNQKFYQIKQALGQKRYKLHSANIKFLPPSLKEHNKQGYNIFIADPRKNIILAYKNTNWQKNVYKDVLHLIKTSS